MTIIVINNDYDVYIEVHKVNKISNFLNSKFLRKNFHKVRSISINYPDLDDVYQDLDYNFSYFINLISFKCSRIMIKEIESLKNIKIFTYILPYYDCNVDFQNFKYLVSLTLEGINIYNNNLLQCQNLKYLIFIDMNTSSNSIIHTLKDLKCLKILTDNFFSEYQINHKIKNLYISCSSDNENFVFTKLNIKTKVKNLYLDTQIISSMDQNTNFKKINCENLFFENEDIF